jgi:hypothetical protein
MVFAYGFSQKLGREGETALPAVRVPVIRVLRL